MEVSSGRILFGFLFIVIKAMVKKRVGCQKGYSFPSIAPSKPPVPLTHYTRTATNRPRQRQVYEPEILADVQKFKENLGYVKSVAPDETQTVVKKPKQISDLWKIYREQDLEKRVNLKTFDEKLNKDTIQSHQNSFQRYVELLGITD